MKPILSVGVCARADPHRLSLCLEGLALQADDRAEVIVVNDGGPPLDDAVEPFAARLVLRHVRLEPPSDAYRLAAARNRILCLARGDRVLFLDQDCVAAPGVLSAHAAYGDRPVVVAGIRNHLVQSEVAALGPADVPALGGRDLRPDLRLGIASFCEASGRLVPISSSWATGCHLSVAAAVLRDIGGYWEEFVGWGYEDVEVALRLGRAGCSLAVRTDLVVVHLDHPSRINRRILRRNQSLLAQTEGDPTVIRRGVALPPPLVTPLERR
jgi:glycosyltransferase involved in cell wall biosynthesis